MLKVRLQRVGRKNDPSFRVVVTDSQNGPKSGKFIEVLGFYDARQGEPQLKADRIKYWLDMGAQASDTVHNLLVSTKVIEGKKINVLPKKQPIKKEGEEVAEAPKADAPAEVEPAPAPDASASVEEVADEPKTEEAPAPEAEPAQEEKAEEKVA